MNSWRITKIRKLPFFQLNTFSFPFIARLPPRIKARFFLRDALTLQPVSEERLPRKERGLCNEVYHPPLVFQPKSRKESRVRVCVSVQGLCY